MVLLQSLSAQDELRTLWCYTAIITKTAHQWSIWKSFHTWSIQWSRWPSAERWRIQRTQWCTWHTADRRSLAVNIYREICANHSALWGETETDIPATQDVAIKARKPSPLMFLGSNYFCIFILTGEDEGTTGAQNIKDETYIKCTYAKLKSGCASHS